jgi:ADP-ribosylglycohydrolase
VSLDGLSVGDAFGECFFVEFAGRMIEARALPRPPWRWTDDTAMAAAIVAVLERHGRIEQDDLAAEFAERYRREPARRYGGGARKLLEQIGNGAAWQFESRRAFDGAGSMGNGAAMRVAPLGAYFADDLPAAVEQARLSAEVTHAHSDGQAGAIAVAVAAAVACGLSDQPTPRPGRRMLEAAFEHAPDGPTRDGIGRALRLHADAGVRSAVAALGNGSRVIAADTVPFTLWCAAARSDSFPEAMWTTVAGLGDRDTTCAIVGGIVAGAVGADGLPAAWLAAREPLPAAGGPQR